VALALTSVVLAPALADLNFTTAATVRE